MYGLPFAVLDMNEKENDTENHANASHHHVGNPQEVVFPTQVGRCRQDHLFPPRKLGNLEVCRRQKKNVFYKDCRHIPLDTNFKGEV